MKKALVVVVILLLICGVWYLGRTFNNWAFYSEVTNETICEMVQFDHLTNKGKEICKK